MLLFIEFGKFILVCLCLSLILIGTEAMIKVPNHFTLVEWQTLFSLLMKNITFKSPTIRFQLFAGAKQMRVICHMEHCKELDLPQTLFGGIFFQ